MIRVLVINNNIVLQSGITVVIKNLIENTTPDTIKYTVVTGPDIRNNAEIFENLGVDVITMPKFSPFNIFNFCSFFKKLFSDKKFDIVHSHFSQIDKIVFPIARKNGVKKCISHSHSAKLSESAVKAFFYKIMHWRLAKCADYCAACSEQAGIALFGSSFPKLPNKLIVKNGIACSKYVFDGMVRGELRRKYGLQIDCKVIGHVGRFSIGKNQTFLVKLLSELEKRGDRYKLFLIGTGETLNVVKELAISLNLKDNVIFTGGRDDVPDLMNIFDLFIMPSLHEGLGISAIEAQANGLECILATSIPRDADLTGVKFLDLNDPISLWADAVESMSFKRHPDFNQKVVDAGYDIQTVGKNITEFYKKLNYNEL